MRDIADWGDGNFVALDTEATGVDPTSEYVVEFSVARLTKNADGTYGKKVDTRLINPGVEIPQGAIDVHGITNERVAEDGLSPESVLEELLGFIVKSVVDDDASIVAMNAKYDLTILETEAARRGVEPLSSRLPSGIAPVLDPMVLDRRFVKFRRRVSETQGARVLKTICAAHGLGWDDKLAHSAEYDTLQASRAVVRMARRCAMPYPKLVSLGYSKSDAGVMRKYVDTCPMEMHDRQVTWYAEQTESLREYFIKKADKSTPDEAAELRESAASITTSWPT